MVRDDYKLINLLNGVATHEFGPDTRSKIHNVTYATAIKKVDSATTINYDEVVSNKVGDDDV